MKKDNLVFIAALIAAIAFYVFWKGANNALTGGTSTNTINNSILPNG